MDSPSRRASTTGAARSPRTARSSEQRSKLSSLVADLSAEAAAIEEGGELEALTAHLRLPTNPLRLESFDDTDMALLANPAAAPVQAEVHLTGHRDEAASELVAEAAPGAVVESGDAPHDAAAATRLDSWIDAEHQIDAPTAVTPEAPAVEASVALAPSAGTPAGDTTGAEALRVSVQLEVARAEAEVLGGRMQIELAARVAAEKRLAEAEDELRFLRAEIQMVGHEKRRPAGPLRRAFLTLTGRRRPVVPANNPKKERLRMAAAPDSSTRRWE